MSAPGEPAPAFSLTASPFRLVASENGNFLAEGPLTFTSARQARVLGLQLIEADGQGALVIDCKGVTSSDSAGLAVLIDWLAAARAAGRSLRFTHVPLGLAALGRISEVNALLERGV